MKRGSNLVLPADQGRALFLIWHDLRPINTKCTLIFVGFHLHSHICSRCLLGFALLDLLLCLVQVGDRRKVAPLGHSFLDLCCLSPFLHPLHDLVHAFDFGGSGGAVSQEIDLCLVDLWFELALVTLPLKPVIIGFFVLFVFEFRSIEQILVPVSRCHLISQLCIQLVHFLICLWL